MNVVRTQIVKIGNSRGIRIPKLLIDQTGLNNEVEIAVERGRLVIRPITRPRGDWEARFREMAANGDDALLDAPDSTKWDKEEWEW
jgi:antitoxin MazE